MSTVLNINAIVGRIACIGTIICVLIYIVQSMLGCMSMRLEDRKHPENWVWAGLAWFTLFLACEIGIACGRS